MVNIAHLKQTTNPIKDRKSMIATQGGLTSVYKTEIVQNLVHHEPQCLYTYVSAGVLWR